MSSSLLRRHVASPKQRRGDPAVIQDAHTTQARHRLRSELMKKMKITLSRDGTQKIEVLNATGDDCLAFTHAMEQRLGRQQGVRTRKPELDVAPPEFESEHEVGS